MVHFFLLNVGDHRRPLAFQEAVITLPVSDEAQRCLDWQNHQGKAAKTAESLYSLKFE